MAMPTIELVFVMRSPSQLFWRSSILFYLIKDTPAYTTEEKTRKNRVERLFWGGNEEDSREDVIMMLRWKIPISFPRNFSFNTAQTSIDYSLFKKMTRTHLKSGIRIDNRQWHHNPHQNVAFGRPGNTQITLYFASLRAPHNSFPRSAIQTSQFVHLIVFFFSLTRRGYELKDPDLQNGA